MVASMVPSTPSSLCRFHPTPALPPNFRLGGDPPQTPASVTATPALSLPPTDRVAPRGRPHCSSLTGKARASVAPLTKGSSTRSQEKHGMAPCHPSAHSSPGLWGRRSSNAQEALSLLPPACPSQRRARGFPGISSLGLRLVPLVQCCRAGACPCASIPQAGVGACRLSPLTHSRGLLAGWSQSPRPWVPPQRVWVHCLPYHHPSPRWRTTRALGVDLVVQA